MRALREKSRQSKRVSTLLVLATLETLLSSIESFERSTGSRWLMTDRQYHVRLAGPARADLDAIVVWCSENHSEELAIRLYQRLRRAIEGLDRQAEMHGLAPESSRFERAVRQLLCGLGRSPSYRVLYEVVGDAVHVLRVRHVAQRPLTIDDLPRS